MADGDVLGNVVSSAANQRRFPVLAARAPPRTYVRPVPQAPSLGAPLSPRTTTGQVRKDGTSQAAQLDQLTNANTARQEEARRRNTGPLAQKRQDLLHRSTFPEQVLGPRANQTSPRRSPRKRPVFAPCNPGEAREAITIPKDKLFLHGQYDSLHGAMLKAQRESAAKMVGGPFVPSSGVATARRLIANPVTLQSKDAETLQCEQRMIAQRSATNLAELNRTYKQNLGSA